MNYDSILRLKNHRMTNNGQKVSLHNQTKSHNFVSLNKYIE